MRAITIHCALILLLALSASGQRQGGRLRFRPRTLTAEDAEEQAGIQYAYNADDRSSGDQVVLVSSADYNGLYGQQAATARSDDDYTPPARSHPQPQRSLVRTKDQQPKAPPVQTIRNYNKVNDDGSFTFGYEAADGSFKEETRGTDCVVRGKYGYVDPDGNKREFTYVSGNPCDPNAPDEEEEPAGDTNDANEPANYPSRPARPLQTTPRTPTTFFQNNYRHHDQEEADEEAVEEPLQQIRQRVIPQPRPNPVRIAYKQATPQYQTTPHQLLSSPVAITPRPLPPATTYRPQLIQATPKPRPQLSYSTSLPTPPAPPPPSYQSTARPVHIDFAAEFAKFQRENAISSTPKTQAKTSEPLGLTGNPIYSTQLIFDPSSGQYNTQLFQTLPSTKGELNLSQRLQPFVAQPPPRPFQSSLSLGPPPSLGSTPSPLYRHQIQHEAPALRSPQELYQRQQAELQYQNSAQLFAQQQQLQQSQLHRDRAAARAQAQKLGLLGASPSTQQPHYYYVSPQRPDAGGQIDAFLKGHGIQF